MKNLIFHSISTRLVTRFNLFFLFLFLSHVYYIFNPQICMCLQIVWRQNMAESWFKKKNNQLHYVACESAEKNLHESNVNLKSRFYVWQSRIRKKSHHHRMFLTLIFSILDVTLSYKQFSWCRCVCNFSLFYSSQLFVVFFT